MDALGVPTSISRSGFDVIASGLSNAALLLKGVLLSAFLLWVATLLLLFGSRICALAISILLILARAIKGVMPLFEIWSLLLVVLGFKKFGRRLAKSTEYQRFTELAASAGHHSETILPSSQELRKEFGKIPAVVLKLIEWARRSQQYCMAILLFWKPRPHWAVVWLRRGLVGSACVFALWSTVSLHYSMVSKLTLVEHEHLPFAVEQSLPLAESFFFCLATNEEDPRHWLSEGVCNIKGWFAPESPPEIHLTIAARHGAFASQLEAAQFPEESEESFRSTLYFYMGDFGEWSALIDPAQPDVPRHPLFLRRSAITEFSTGTPREPHDPETEESDPPPIQDAAIVSQLHDLNRSLLRLVNAVTGLADFESNLMARLDEVQRQTAFARNAAVWEVLLRLDEREEMLGAQFDVLLSLHDRQMRQRLAEQRNYLDMVRFVAAQVQDLGESEQEGSPNPPSDEVETPVNEVVEDLPELTALDQWLQFQVRDVCHDTTITQVGSVQFAENRFASSAVLAAQIDRIVERMRSSLSSQHPRTLFVLGSASSTGDAVFNQTISERRAEIVAQRIARQLIGGPYADPLTASDRLHEEHGVRLYSHGIGEQYTSGAFRPRSVVIWSCEAVT